MLFKARDVSLRSLDENITGLHRSFLSFGFTVGRRGRDGSFSGSADPGDPQQTSALKGSSWKGPALEHGPEHLIEYSAFKS